MEINSKIKLFEHCIFQIENNVDENDEYIHYN